MIIDTWYWVLVSAIFGLVGGSFAGAQVWRQRWDQLCVEKAEGQPYDAAEYTKLGILARPAHKTDRSRCLECGHQLAWYDLLPLVSWLSTSGKCRYCSRKIGWFELSIEVGMMAAFVVSYLLWPYQLIGLGAITMLVLWMVGLVAAGILFAYDYKWSLLPDRATYSLVVLGVAYASLGIVDGVMSIASVIGSVALFSGVYGGLYFFSLWRYGPDNTWVGFGDVKLSVALGLFLGDWRLSLLAIFLANLLGTLLVLPSLIRGKINRKAHIPFGPLLLVGTFIALISGGAIIDWYLGFLTL